MNLAELKPGSRGVIVSLNNARLMEMGLTIGALVEITHEAPFGGTIAVTVRGSLIALGLEDARAVRVEAR